MRLKSRGAISASGVPVSGKGMSFCKVKREEEGVRRGWSESICGT
jgi:hypothetical protein